MNNFLLRTAWFLLVGVVFLPDVTSNPAVSELFKKTLGEYETAGRALTILILWCVFINHITYLMNELYLRPARKVKVEWPKS